MKRFAISVIGALATLSSPLQAQGPELNVCLDRYRPAMGGRPGQGTYRATIAWNGQAPRSPRRLVVGAYDTSQVVWVQRAFGILQGRGTSENVLFVISDDSAYPLEIAIYQLTDAAYAEYERECRSGDCYFGPDQAGVERLTEPVERDRPGGGDIAPDC